MEVNSRRELRPCGAAFVLPRPPVASGDPGSFLASNMHILPRTVSLYLKAEVLRSLPAKVELARVRSAHFADALIRIENHKVAAFSAYARGNRSQISLAREMRQLMSLRNTLVTGQPLACSRRELQTELDSLARSYILPQLRAADAKARSWQASPTLLASVHYARYHR